MSRPVRSSDEDLKSEDVVPLFNEVVTPMSADVRGLFSFGPERKGPRSRGDQKSVKVC